MNISVEEILQNEIFTNIKVIAGEKGLKNKVKQIYKILQKNRL